jgi:hypothetical protein
LSIKFRAKIDARNRIQIPYRIEDPSTGDLVMVTLEKLTAEEYHPSKGKSTS